MVISGQEELLSSGVDKYACGEYLIDTATTRSETILVYFSDYCSRFIVKHPLINVSILANISDKLISIRLSQVDSSFFLTGTVIIRDSSEGIASWSQSFIEISVNLIYKLKQPLLSTSEVDLSQFSSSSLL